MVEQTLNARYVKSLGEMPAIKPDSKAMAGSYGYEYLSLPALLNTIRPILAANGLAVRQELHAAPESPQLLTVTTIVFDDASELVVGEYPVQVLQNPQATGSAITYARRYSLTAAMGLMPGNDDDGQAAAKVAPANKPVETNPGCISRQQGNQLWAAAKNSMTQAELMEFLSAELGREIRQLREVKVEEFDPVMAALKDVAAVEAGDTGAA